MNMAHDSHSISTEWPTIEWSMDGPSRCCVVGLRPRSFVDAGAAAPADCANRDTSGRCQNVRSACVPPISRPHTSPRRSTEPNGAVGGSLTLSHRCGIHRGTPATPHTLGTCRWMRLQLVTCRLVMLFGLTIRRRIVSSGLCSSTVGWWLSYAPLGLDVAVVVRVTLLVERLVDRLGTAAE
jgi:hypothetical protein